MGFLGWVFRANPDSNKLNYTSSCSMHGEQVELKTRGGCTDVGLRYGEVKDFDPVVRI